MPSLSNTMTIPARAESLGPVTAFAREGAGEAQLPETQARQLDLLVEEVLMNVARHAYPAGAPGEVTVSYLVRGPGELVMEFSDQGVAFDPLAASPPDLTLDLAHRPVGGLGIFLLRKFASSLSYRREHDANRLSFGISAKP